MFNLVSLAFAAFVRLRTGGDQKALHRHQTVKGQGEGKCHIVYNILRHLLSPVC